MCPNNYWTCTLKCTSGHNWASNPVDIGSLNTGGHGIPTEHELKCRHRALLRTCSSCTHATLTELGIGGTDLMTIECTHFIMGFELPRFTQKHISHHDCVPSRANVLPLLRWCCTVRMPELCSAHWIMLPSSINPSTIAHLSLLSPYTKQAWQLVSMWPRACVWSLLILHSEACVLPLVSPGPKILMFQLLVLHPGTLFYHCSAWLIDHEFHYY